MQILVTVVCDTCPVTATATVQIDQKTDKFGSRTGRLRMHGLILPAGWLEVYALESVMDKSTVIREIDTAVHAKQIAPLRCRFIDAVLCPACTARFHQPGRGR